MAQIIPSDLTRAALAGAKSRELETLRLLKDALEETARRSSTSITSSTCPTTG
jgi:hypothetical protein